MPHPHSFYRPFNRASEKTIQTNKLKIIAKLLTQCILAGSASYIVVMPSIRYSQNEEGFSKIAFPFCTILSGFLMNVYAIERLIFEIENGIAINQQLIISSILGSISTLPSFFMQVDLTKGESLLAPTAVLLGCIPMQILGVWEFYVSLFKNLKKIKTKLSQNKQLLEQERLTEKFLLQLEAGTNFLLSNKAEFDFSCKDPEKLLPIFFNMQKIKVESWEYSKINQFMSGFAAYLGVLLVEIINLSFAKATLDIYQSKMSAVGANICTILTILPLIILCADFGYHGSQAAWQTLSSLIYEVLSLNFSPPKACSSALALNPSLFMSINFLMILIGLFSYAALIQFNKETLFNILSSENLNLLNTLTKIGGIIFNTFALISIANEICIFGLSKSRNTEIKDRAEFYKFMQAVQSGYKSLLRTEYFPEVNTLVASAQTQAPNTAFFRLGRDYGSTSTHKSSLSP